MFSQKNRTSQLNQQQTQSTINNQYGAMNQINWITQKAFSAVDGRSSNSQSLNMTNQDIKCLNDTSIMSTFKKSRTKQYEESPVKNLNFQQQQQPQIQQQVLQFQNIQQQQGNQNIIGNQMCNNQKNNQFAQGNIGQQNNVQNPYQQNFGQVNQNQSLICPIATNPVSQQMLSQQLSTQNQQVSQYEQERIQNIQDQLNEIQQRQNSKLNELQEQNNRILALMREQQELQYIGKQMTDKAIKSIDKLEEKFDILARDREAQQMQIQQQGFNNQENQNNLQLQQRILNVEQGLQAFVRDNQIFQNQILTILNNDKEERALLRKTQFESEKRRK